MCRANLSPRGASPVIDHRRAPPELAADSTCLENGDIQEKQPKGSTVEPCKVFYLFVLKRVSYKESTQAS